MLEGLQCFWTLSAHSNYGEGLAASGYLLMLLLLPFVFRCVVYAAAVVGVVVDAAVDHR